MRNLVRALPSKLIAIVVTLSFCIVLLEIGLRLEGRLPSNVTDGIFVQHGDSYRLGKDVEKITRWSSRSFLTRTNSMGFRDSANGPVDLSKRPYFAFLGDSVTFGNGADYENTFLGIFKATAGRAGFEVQNLAIGGHHLPDQVEVLRDLVATAPRPPRVTVVCMTPGFIYTFDAKIEGILVKDGYLFDAHSWRLAYIRTILANTSASFCFFRDGIRKVQARWFGPPTGDVPPYLRIFSNSSRLHDSDTSERFENSLNQLELYCRSVSTELVYVYLPLIDSDGLAKLSTKAGLSPADFDVHYFEALMLNHCKNYEVPFINLEPALSELSRCGTPLTFGDDPHYSTPAHKIVAEYLYNSFRTTSLLDNGQIR
jgi:hypothetical protein